MKDHRYYCVLHLSENKIVFMQKYVTDIFKNTINSQNFQYAVISK